MIDGPILVNNPVAERASASIARKSRELKAILTGIEEAHRGETVDLGSFAQYADDEDGEAD